MVSLHLLFSFSIAALLVLIFASISPQNRGWQQITPAFLLILFATWAGGIWITPVGPLLLGVPWLPFAAVGLIVALLLMGLRPGNYRTSTQSVRTDPAILHDAPTRNAINFSIALLALLLIATIVGHYFLFTGSVGYL
ncbi:MAG: hypothetical protein K1X83_13170 [Oligoflexia bacterium]|nr:hypothetical protein [Oligoflexia bacterium]